MISFSVKLRGKLSVSEIKIQTQNERCPANPRVQNPDIAIEIYPFIVKLFYRLISGCRVQLGSLILERMYILCSIAAIDVTAV